MTLSSIHYKAMWCHKNCFEGGCITIFIPLRSKESNSFKACLIEVYVK